jgi:hypothetical protein
MFWSPKKEKKIEIIIEYDNNNLVVKYDFPKGKEEAFLITAHNTLSKDCLQIVVNSIFKSDNEVLKNLANNLVKEINKSSVNTDAVAPDYIHPTHVFKRINSHD